MGILETSFQSAAKMRRVPCTRNDRTKNDCIHNKLGIAIRSKMKAQNTFYTQKKLKINK
jgi:hypothetical protein